MSSITRELCIEHRIVWCLVLDGVVIEHLASEVEAARSALAFAMDAEDHGSLVRIVTRDKDGSTRPVWPAWSSTSSS